jgi:hypothetical protein
LDTNTHITQNITTKNKTKKNKPAHKATQTVKDILQLMNYRVEKGKEIKLSLIQALETY